MGAVGPCRIPPAAYRGKGRGFQTVSARSKRGPGKGLGIQVEGGGRLTAFLLPSPAHPLRKARRLISGLSACSQGRHWTATRAGGGGGGAVPSASAPHSGSRWLPPCPQRLGEPGPASVPAASLPATARACPRGHTSPGSARVKAAAERRALG